MNEQSITSMVSRSLSGVLRRFVRKLNETDTGTGTEAPVTDAQLRELAVRARYESECI